MSKAVKTVKPFQFEAISDELTERQKLFCMYYVESKFNGTEAAKRAGYEASHARSYASTLLSDPNISEHINLIKNDLGARIGVSAEMIAREYMKVAFVDISDIVDDDGNLRKLNEMPKHARSAISGLEVNEQNILGSNVATVTVKKVKLHNKLDALDKLAKMIGADGVLKVAQTNAAGEDVEPPLNDVQVDKIIEALKASK